MPEFKFSDFIIVGIFSITVIVAWVRLKFRIDRNDEIHKEIREILNEFADTSRSRFDKLMVKILDVEISVHEVKTDVAVIINEQKNILRRLNNIEK